MGKSRARRLKPRSLNPTGIPSIKEIECEEIMSIDFETGTVESIIEKLQSRGADDKECAAFTIANMASNSSFVASIVDQKVIRIAGPLLLDHNLAVRHAVSGCLRNIAACGDPSVCQAMVDQDILTSLVALLSKYKDPWAPVKSIDNKIDSKSEIFLEACNLLWSLCESSDTAVAIFNEKKLINVLLPCLNVEVYGLQIPLAVAQCLHTVGEENPDAIEELCQHLIQDQLKALMTIKPVEPEHILLKTLAAGIMLNTMSGKIHNCMSDVTSPVIEVIVSTLNEPINPPLTLLFEQITSHKCEKLNKYHDEKDLEEKLSTINKTIKILDHMFQAKQVSLEILANICFGDDSKDEWEDVSSSDTNEEIEMDVDEAMSAPLKLGLGVPCEIHAIIVNEKLLDKVINQIVIPSAEVLKIISENTEGRACLKRLGIVRCRALFCLNNMIHELRLEDIGGTSKLFDLWMYIANLVFKQTDSDSEQMEAGIGSMRAILQKLVEADCSSHFTNMVESDLELLINICQQAREARIKTNVVGVLGTIGCLLGKPQLLQTSHKLISVIGSFLLDICTKGSDLVVIAEALDAIFDVFAEDPLDGIAQEIKLVEKLTHMFPLFKGKVKQQRKALGAHYPIIMTVQKNLIRFIKYKNELNKK